MLQDIHDYISKLFPQTGIGTKTGIWRNIEREKPVLDEGFIRSLNVFDDPPPKKESKSAGGKLSKQSDEPSLSETTGRSQPMSESLSRLEHELALEVYKKKLIISYFLIKISFARKTGRLSFMFSFQMLL
jgi:hypothetical protein